ncbi:MULTISPECIES: hypothetical protein [Serratia]|uniref:hypothetical protein n=1 Tax=Serratia TaxID=613 RepID=UPI00101EBBC2|nr:MULTISPECIES: hypothetical protein [Serratia]CAI0842273.1 Putative papain-like cysteine peptidase (DUF1796) [Serratia ficaria]CAI0886086.1 Putative papain-like cysteine peptidase (DUF1796) [Serratia ficaria]CAI1519025.1 Putative papain-like cysteine peptidase (DUF1796) [Serratia ficaria]CAI2403481.1 Putative papain-like cysteine peptidase (DUF1796) [Serratia ficaria]CAI2426267.1 Putative papain-like cysteine peptidase (DUF1796) [Serratia ficaria]
MVNEKLLCFENMGDNCEFGFYLRSKGIENGSLFRWSLIKDHQDVLKLLSTDFDGFYQLHNLQPTWSNMLVDNANGVIFHTELYSQQIDGKWFFEDNDEKIKEKYLIEKEKIDYLVRKFKASLKEGNKVFVIKKNNNQLDISVIRELARVLNRYGRARILIVFQSDDIDKHGIIEHDSDTLLISYIDRFADYSQADNISVEGWDKIIKNVADLL